MAFLSNFFTWQVVLFCCSISFSTSSSKALRCTSNFLLSKYLCCSPWLNKSWRPNSALARHCQLRPAVHLGPAGISMANAIFCFANCLATVTYWINPGSQKIYIPVELVLVPKSHGWNRLGCPYFKIFSYPA